MILSASNFWKGKIGMLPISDKPGFLFASARCLRERTLPKQSHTEMQVHIGIPAREFETRNLNRRSTGSLSVEVDLLHRPIPIDFASPNLVRGLMLRRREAERGADSQIEVFD